MHITTISLKYLPQLDMNSKLKKTNSIKFETESIKSSLCDYSDAFVLFTGDITVTADNNADVAFCTIFYV